MGLRTIRTEGDEVLRKKAKKVKNIDARTLELVQDMIDTMRNAGGVGLAAPQVGILRRIVVIELEGKQYVLINPRVISATGEQTGKEACLSIPGMEGIVTRPLKVTVEADNIKGEKETYTGEGLLARAFCHEIDHLDGILYIDLAETFRKCDD